MGGRSSGIRAHSPPRLGATEKISNAATASGYQPPPGGRRAPGGNQLPRMTGEPLVAGLRVAGARRPEPARPRRRRLARGAAGVCPGLANPREKLLTGLGYAARFFEPFERLPAPRRSRETRLDIEEAFDFLRGCKRPCWRRAPVSGCPLVAPPRSPPETAPSPLGGLRHDGPGRDEPREPRELPVRHRPRGRGDSSKEEFEALVALESQLVRLRGQRCASTPNKSTLRPGVSSPHATSRVRSACGKPCAWGSEESRDKGLEVRSGRGMARRLGRLSGDRKLETLPVPAGLEAELRPYQRTGSSGSTSCARRGSAPCPRRPHGPGKTIQTLSLLVHDQEQGRLELPALVVCPTSVVSNWQREAERFAPTLRCLAHQGSNRLRARSSS